MSHPKITVSQVNDGRWIRDRSITDRSCRDNNSGDPPADLLKSETDIQECGPGTHCTIQKDGQALVYDLYLQQEVETLSIVLCHTHDVSEE